MISCLSIDPFLLVNGSKITIPHYDKNDLIPFNPIQKLNSFAESGQALILSHGAHELEFGKIAQVYGEDEFVIARFCQMAIDRPFKVNTHTKYTLPMLIRMSRK